MPMRIILAALPLLLVGGAQGAAPPPPGGEVVVVQIVGPIDYAKLALVKRAAGLIREEKPALALFEIDTPGGRGDFMMEIGEEIMNLPVPTAAYIRPMGSGGGAWSAGVYIAISCKRLFMHPGTVIGAATPVDGATGEAVGEKYVSAFREKFRARAEQNGYPGNLIVAMVDPSLELFEVTIEGKKHFATVRDLENLKAQGKEFSWPTTPYDTKEKLLTLTDRQAVDAGIARGAATRQEVLREAGLSAGAAETVVSPSWSESLVGFVTSPVVSMLLLVVGVLGIWIELKTPGFGAAGIVGIVAMALFLFGHHLAGLAEISEVLLIVFGVVLIFVEIFFFPGVGVFAIGGALCILAGLILAMQTFVLPSPETAPWQMDAFLSSIGRVIASFVGASIGLLLVLRFLPRVPVVGRVVLQAAIEGAAPMPAAEAALAGKEGHAVTPLRPGGKVEVGGQMLDVVAEGEFVAQGEPVVVLRVEGMRIVVGKLKR